MASPEAVRQALIQRVSRKVSGHGVTRRSIEGAVDRVLAALPSKIAAAAIPPRIAVLSAPSAPGLASRARQLLEREGVRVLDIGTGTAGRYTVATIRLAGEGTTDLQRLAGELGASVSVLADADARQVTA
jgi:threonine dehydrogenase-like Zn-dependent dehydrogenase